MGTFVPLRPQFGRKIDSENIVFDHINTKMLINC